MAPILSKRRRFRHFYGTRASTLRYLCTGRRVHVQLLAPAVLVCAREHGQKSAGGFSRRYLADGDALRAGDYKSPMIIVQARLTVDDECGISAVKDTQRQCSNYWGLGGVAGHFSCERSGVKKPRAACT